MVAMAVGLLFVAVYQHPQWVGLADEARPNRKPLGLSAWIAVSFAAWIAFAHWTLERAG